MGFTSPSEDYKQNTISLEKHLIQRPAATFFMTVSGYSMTEAGITNGAILVVDRSLKPQHDDIVVVVLDGEHKVRRIRFDRGSVCLLANEGIAEVNVSQEQDFKVWGVVSSAINQYRQF